VGVTRYTHKFGVVLTTTAKISMPPLNVQIMLKSGEGDPLDPSPLGSRSKSLQNRLEMILNLS
jgi:hypothetical protein